MKLEWYRTGDVWRAKHGELVAVVHRKQVNGQRRWWASIGTATWVWNIGRYNFVRNAKWACEDYMLDAVKKYFNKRMGLE